MENDKEKSRTIASIIAILAIIFAIIMAFVAINNFRLFVVICIVGTIIFSIANIIVRRIRQ